MNKSMPEAVMPRFVKLSQNLGGLPVNVSRFVPKQILFALVAGCAVLLTACSGKTVVKDLPEATPPPPNAEYKIGPGDSLNVFVWNRPELSVTVPVRPDGLISTPLVENMSAAGKTPSQLARDMEGVLSEFVRSPKVNIIVTQFQGTFSEQIRVVGQAAKPQSLPYKASMTLLDVMIQVGGLAPFAAGNRAKIVRRQEGKQLEIPVRLNDLLNDGDIRANLAMLPGDVLIIPESRF
jgi:polysaccharide biosynthesis/export protein